MAGANAEELSRKPAKGRIKQLSSAKCQRKTNDKLNKKLRTINF